MKIGEFARMNRVTTKMLRHYDDIGLLEPSLIDANTGYRSYDTLQSHKLNWILILKNLDFSLVQIKELLKGPIDSDKFIIELLQKRIEINIAMKENIQKKLQIDKLIHIIEKEGFEMNKKIDLLTIEQESVHEIKKNIPNMELFLENTINLLDKTADNENLSVVRFDICHFKQVNDDCGFEVGDRVILTIYTIIKENCESFFNSFSLGRGHGDEFVVFVEANQAKVKLLSEKIISDISSFDFVSMGCNKDIGVYIGAVVKEKSKIANIRQMIDDSNEAVFTAKRNGKNSIFVD